MAINSGQRVRHWRELKGMTQLELAKRSKIEPARLCRIELGKTEAKASEIERIAKSMDLSMAEFYGSVDEAHAP